MNNKTLWADPGFEVAHAQCLIPYKVPAAEQMMLPADTDLQVTEDNHKLTVKGGSFRVVFNTTEGIIGALEYGKEKIIHTGTSGSGHLLNVYRAPTDNNEYMAGKWKKYGIDSLYYEVENFHYEKINNRVHVTIDFNCTGKKDTGFLHSVQYQIFTNGCMRVKNSVHPYGELPVLPKTGIRMALSSEYFQIHWLGRGPHENYPDRKTGSPVGLYTKSVDEMYVPYVRPQETGNREDVRWAALTNKAGNGIVMVADAPFSFSALHFTAGDLDKADHTHELHPRDEIIFCIDCAQLGLGNGSCGPGVLDQYLVHPVDYEFVYELRPWFAKKNNLREAVRLTLPEQKQDISDKQEM